MPDEYQMNDHNYALGFSTLGKETPPQRVCVQGALPPWLEGTLVRTGPAKFEAEQQSLGHWFDGFAMLHAFSFSGGNATYAGKFLQSRRLSLRRAARQNWIPRVCQRPVPFDIQAVCAYVLQAKK